MKTCQICGEYLKTTAEEKLERCVYCNKTTQKGEIMKIKFYWNGIRVDGKLIKASYYAGPYVKESKLHPETVTVHASSYLDHLPHLDDLPVENNSDDMVDHFETDKIHIPPTSRYWADAVAACLAQEEHWKRSHGRHLARCEAYHALHTTPKGV